MKDSKVKHLLLILYEFFYKKTYVISKIKYRLNILNVYNTINYIKSNQRSIARFGDGEFKLMLGAEDLAFQSRNDELAKKFKLTLSNNNADLLLCVPGCLNSLKKMNEKARKHWYESLKKKAGKGA